MVPEAAEANIVDYYLREEMAVSTGPLDKARSQHHALVAAARKSASKLSVFTNTNTTAMTTMTGTKKEKSGRELTVSSAYQKHNLVTLSAMCGLLVTRLLLTGHSRSRSHSSYIAPHHLWRPLKNQAQIINHYIHSALASEILIGNRYYRRIAQQSALQYPIGNTNKKYTIEDIAPESVSATKNELCSVYASATSRLTETVKQYKRGLVSLSDIHSDPQFVRLLSLFWRYCNLVTTTHREFEKCQCWNGGVGGGVDMMTVDKFESQKDIKRFFILSELLEVSVLVPLLYNYDVVRLFDSPTQSFVKYVRTLKSTLIRLSNDGLTSAFLSFAAIEPAMVTPEMAPKHGPFHKTVSLQSCANHIPSRHPVYGALRVQYSAHIPLTAEATTTDVVKGKVRVIMRGSERTQHPYVPVQTKMEELRSRSIQSIAEEYIKNRNVSQVVK